MPDLVEQPCNMTRLNDTAMKPSVCSCNVQPCFDLSKAKAKPFYHHPMFGNNLCAFAALTCVIDS